MSTPAVLPAEFFKPEAPDTLPAEFFSHQTAAATKEPSFYEKLTAPIDTGATNPVSRFASSLGGAVIGAPKATFDTMSDLAKSYFNPRRPSQVGQNISESIAAYAKPETWKGIPSVLPEALGQGVGSVVAGEIAGKLPGTIKAELPSTANAGASLADIKGSVGQIPIDMTKPGNTALEIYTQSQRGGTLPKSVRDFVNRATKPDSPPLTYAEAKDFQSNISRLSADEYQRMNPNAKRMVGQLNADLKDSLASAADIQGKGQQFQDAMKEYHNAMRLKGMSDDAISYAWKTALAGAGIYGLSKLLGIEAPKL